MYTVYGVYVYVVSSVRLMYVCTCIHTYVCISNKMYVTTYNINYLIPPVLSVKKFIYINVPPPNPLIVFT